MEETGSNIASSDVATPQDSRSSLLKSMLTCPMSSIMPIPNLGTFPKIPKDDSSIKNTTEIRKMLSEPVKYSSPFSVSKFMTLGQRVEEKHMEISPLATVASSPFRSILSVNASPQSPSTLSLTPASNLLKSLSLGSLQQSNSVNSSHQDDSSAVAKPGIIVKNRTTEETGTDQTSPMGVEVKMVKSKPGIIVKNRTTGEGGTDQASPMGIKLKVVKSKRETNAIKSVKRKKLSKSGISERESPLQDTDDLHEGDDTKSKAQAIEEAVGNFSHFLHSTMSQHDFSKDQMQIIIESAIKSATRVITDTAKQANATETMRETATNFINHAIGNAIRTEALRKETGKTILGKKKEKSKGASLLTPYTKFNGRKEKGVKRKQEMVKTKTSKKKKKVQAGEEEAGSQEMESTSYVKESTCNVMESTSNVMESTSNVNCNKAENEDMAGVNIVIKQEPGEYVEGDYETLNKPNNCDFIDDSVRNRPLEEQFQINKNINDELKHVSSPSSINIKTEPIDFNNVNDNFESGNGSYNEEMLQTDTRPCVNNSHIGAVGRSMEEDTIESTEVETVSLYNKRSHIQLDSEGNDTRFEIKTKGIGMGLSDSKEMSPGLQVTDPAYVDIKQEPMDHEYEPTVQDTQSDQLEVTPTDQSVVSDTGEENRLTLTGMNDMIGIEIRNELRKPISHSVNLSNRGNEEKADSNIIYSCCTCGQEFEHKGTLRVHQRGHNLENKSYQCPVCGKCVTDSSYLKIHMRTHQSELTDSSYRKMLGVKFIQQSEAAVVTMRKCDTCHQQFLSDEDYQIHLRVHKGEKPYKCDTCEQTFVRKELLTMHKSIHTGEKPFACDICGMRFRLKAGLKLHVNVHTDDKPKKCPYCPASYTRKQHLHRHMCYHFGERPFVCNYCKKPFISREQLSIHTKKVHPDGGPGKRGVYKQREVPELNKLGPAWKGMLANLSKPAIVCSGDQSDDSVVPCYPCGVCGETYTVISELVEHLDTHNDTSSLATLNTDDNIADYIDYFKSQNKSEDDRQEGEHNTADSANNTTDSANNTTHSTVNGSHTVNHSKIDAPNQADKRLGTLSLTGLLNSPVLGLGSQTTSLKAFKCPFCEEAFDMPGPRINHIHQYHPITSLSGLDEKDPDFHLKSHLIRNRAMEDISSAPGMTPSTSGSTSSKLSGSHSYYSELLKKLKGNKSHTTNGNDTRVILDIDDQLQSHMTSHLKTNHLTGNPLIASHVTGNLQIKNLQIPKPLPRNTSHGSVVNIASKVKEKKEYTCPHCDRVYFRQSSLTRHINETHRSAERRQQMVLQRLADALTSPSQGKI